MLGVREWRQVASVKKALVTPLRERFSVRMKGGPDLDVQGNIVDHEHTIGEGRDKVAGMGTVPMPGNGSVRR